MKILGLIPARGGSKGVPRKNIRSLGGKALIQYSIDAALACSAIHTLVVSTEDEEIAECSKQLGASVPFLRPQTLATDSAPTLGVMQHAMAFFEEKGQHFDAICLLQATCPFRTTKEISEAINSFQEKRPDSLVSMREVPHQYNPYWVFEENKDNGFLNLAKGDISMITRRQDLPKTYYRDGSIYITKRDVLMEQNSIYGKKIAYCVSQNQQHINIDTMSDWEAAEQMIANG